MTHNENLKKKMLHAWLYASFNRFVSPMFECTTETGFLDVNEEEQEKIDISVIIPNYIYKIALPR